MDDDDPKPTAPLRDHKDDKDFEGTEHKVSEQSGEVTEGSDSDDDAED